MNYSYDTPIEVTEGQYNACMHQAKGIIAGRKDNESGKYYIKIWITKYNSYITELINNN